MNDMTDLVHDIDNNLLPNLDIKSVDPHDPIVVKNLPEPWILLGVGNYAAAIIHPDFSEYVVKVYAPDRPGIKEEIEVYNRIEDHPSFSKCFYYTDNYLILKRHNGETLYDCINKGIQIPKSIIKDIDDALIYVKNLGLSPHDVHAKNVMIVDGKGIVVDVSDFLKLEACSHWDDFKKAYYSIYISFFYKRHPAIPNFCLNFIMKSYRFLKALYK